MTTEIEIINDSWLAVLEKNKESLGANSPKVQMFLKHYMPDINISLYGTNKEKIVNLFKVLAKMQTPEQILNNMEEFFKSAFGYKNFEDLEKNTNPVQSKIIKRNFEYDYGYMTYQKLMNFEMIKKYIEKLNQTPVNLVSLEKFNTNEKKIISDRGNYLQYKEAEKAPDIKVFITRLKSEFDIKNFYCTIRIPKEQLKILIVKFYSDLKALSDFLGIPYNKLYNGTIIFGQQSRHGMSAFDHLDKIIYLNDVHFYTFLHEWFYHLNYNLGNYLYHLMLKHDVTIPQGYWTGLTKEISNDALPETKIVGMIDLLKLNLETYELKFNLKNKMQDQNSELMANTFEIWLSERIGKNLKVILNNQKIQDMNLDKAAKSLICHFWDYHWKQLNDMYLKSTKL